MDMQLTASEDAFRLLWNPYKGILNGEWGPIVKVFGVTEHVFGSSAPITTPSSRDFQWQQLVKQVFYTALDCGRIMEGIQKLWTNVLPFANPYWKYFSFFHFVHLVVAGS